MTATAAAADVAARAAGPRAQTRRARALTDSRDRSVVHLDREAPARERRCPQGRR